MFRCHSENLAKLLVMMGRAGEAEPIYNSLGAKPSAVRKNIFVDSVLNSQRGVSAAVYQKVFMRT